MEERERIRRLSRSVRGPSAIWRSRWQSRVSGCQTPFLLEAHAAEAWRPLIVYQRRRQQNALRMLRLPLLSFASDLRHVLDPARAVGCVYA